jgi:SAM-dependent methyltransferase
MTRASDQPHRQSFRDPGGVLFSGGERIVRFVRPDARAAAETFLTSEFYQTLVSRGQLVSTRRLDRPPSELDSLLEAWGTGHGDGLWLEHERIAVPTYPYEWSPRMLHAAAVLTLTLATDGVPHGFGLKDATPDNILFRGPRPVFVDVLSFEQRDPRDPTWLAYAQFVRTFLLPLLVNRALDLPLATVLSGTSDGLEPEQVYRWLGWGSRVRPPGLSLVTMPTWLAPRADRAPALHRPRREASADKARFVLVSLLRHLARTLRSVAPVERTSRWSDYTTQHEAPYVERKTAAITRALARWPRDRMLDIGCNTGQFAILAARSGAQVVAIDADAAVIDAIWTRARDESLAILPLVANLARPTPAMGWMNRERPALLERLHERFDGVLMLAVLHHFLVTERVPLDEVVELLASLTTDLACVEFVAPSDPLFQRLSRGRDELYRHLTQDHFERQLGRRFEIVDRVTLVDERRWLYTARRRAASP